MNNEVKQKIDSLIHNNAIVLFMKGTKDRPQCGFSKQVVGVLSSLVDDFVAVDVLSDPELREGIKVYSSWPTIPQLYIDREFIGGCDIVLDLYNKGELGKILKIERAHEKPVINLTENALQAFKNALSDAEPDEAVRLSISTDFEHSLSFDQKKHDDFCWHFDNVELIMDPYSACRAHNVSIDFITENLEAGFQFDNPNVPPPVKELSVNELKAWRDQGTPSLLIDVRPVDEWEKAHISFARPLASIGKEELASLKKDQAIVFHCHHGGRSRRTAESFRKKGFTNLYNLTGGIDAWSRTIDKTVPLY